MYICSMAFGGILSRRACLGSGMSCMLRCVGFGWASGSPGGYLKELGGKTLLCSNHLGCSSIRGREGPGPGPEGLPSSWLSSLEHHKSVWLELEARVEGGIGPAGTKGETRTGTESTWLKSRGLVLFLWHAQDWQGWCSWSRGCNEPTDKLLV